MTTISITQKYQSPIHILENENLDLINSYNLKQLQKKLMLQFDLNQSSTIKINQKEYDKTAILEAFEAIRSDFQFHLQVYENKRLLGFLEKGEINFFVKKEVWTNFENPTFKEKIMPYFLYQLKEILYKSVSTIGFGALNKLKAIHSHELTFLSESEREYAYTKAFNFLENFMNDFQLVANEPLKTGTNNRLKNEVIHHLSPHYFNVLKILPESRFSPIFGTYEFLSKMVFINSFPKSDNSQSVQFRKIDLRAIATALEVILHKDPLNGPIQDSLDTIKQAIHDGNLPKEGDNIWAIIKIIFILLSILGAFLN